MSDPGFPSERTVQIHPTDDPRCNHVARGLGRAYPRFCKLCGLGPCSVATPERLPMSATDEKAALLERTRRWIADLEITAASAQRFSEETQGAGYIYAGSEVRQAADLRALLAFAATSK